MCSRQVGRAPLQNSKIKLTRNVLVPRSERIYLNLNIDIAVHVGDFLPRRPAEEARGGLSQGEVSWEFSIFLSGNQFPVGSGGEQDQHHHPDTPSRDFLQRRAVRHHTDSHGLN